MIGGARSARPTLQDYPFMNSGNEREPGGRRSDGPPGLRVRLRSGQGQREPVPRLRPVEGVVTPLRAPAPRDGVVVVPPAVPLIGTLIDLMERAVKVYWRIVFSTLLNG